MKDSLQLNVCVNGMSKGYVVTPISTVEDEGITIDVNVQVMIIVKLTVSRV